MKKLARLTFETLSWLFFFGGVAHAGPLALAITSFSAFLGGSTVFGQLILAGILTAAKIGLGLLQRASQEKQRAPGIKGDLAVGGDNPLSFIAGFYATAGQLEYGNTWGGNDDTPNAWLVQVISVSDLPVSGTTSTIWVNGQKCTISADLDPDGKGYGVTEFKRDDNYYLFVKFYDGTQTTYDPYLMDAFGADPDRPWKIDMIARGMAYFIVSAYSDRKFFNGFPKFRFEINGISLYNPAKDSTNGGSGLHRWNDQSTWEPSSNNAVIVYNITRGVYYGSQWIFGGQNLPALMLPAASWIAAINECDVAISLAAGGTEPQYRSGYEITTDQQPLDIIDLFLDGCSGHMAEIGGYYKIQAGAPGASVYSFTDADIMATEDLNLDPFPGLEATNNGAHARYPEPLEAWSVKDAPVYIRTDYESDDGGRRLLANLTFSTTPYNTQVQRLIKAAVEANRRFRRHVVPLPPEAWLLEPNDVVSWTSTREGYTNKKFQITAISGKQGLIQIVSLQEIDTTDYNWVPGTDEKTYTIGYVGGIFPPVQAMVGWSVAPATFNDTSTAARRPSIQVSFAANVTDVRSIRVQVRLASSQALVFDSEIPYGDIDPLIISRSIVLNGTFLPNENYEARGMFVPYSGRDTSFSSWLAVTTPNVRLGDNDVYLPGMVADINAQIFPINTNVRDLIDQKRAIALKAMEQDSGNYQDKQYVLQRIQSQYGQVTAEYNSSILVATGPGSAIVQRLDTLEATIPGLATAAALNSLSVTVGVQGGQITANADAITALNVSVGNFSATGLFRTTVEATEAGALATIGLSVSATGGGATSSASIILSALAGGISRVGILADQFFIKSGANSENPFVFSGGVARLNVANIGTITAGILQSADGKVVFNLTNKTLIFSE